MLDYGYPQVTSTEMLKSCVHNEAVLVKAPSALSTASSMLSMSSNRTKASAAANIPITMMSAKGSSSKNEIYVDIVERLTVLFSAAGYVVNSSIDGSILMKSFLSGNPELRLALNEDLVIGKGGAYGSVSGSLLGHVRKVTHCLSSSITPGHTRRLQLPRVRAPR